MHIHHVFWELRIQQKIRQKRCLFPRSVCSSSEGPIINSYKRTWKSSEGFPEWEWHDVVYILKRSLWCPPEEQTTGGQCGGCWVYKVGDDSGWAEVGIADLVRNGWTWDV